MIAGKATGTRKAAAERATPVTIEAGTIPFGSMGQSAEGFLNLAQVGGVNAARAANGE